MLGLFNLLLACQLHAPFTLGRRISVSIPLQWRWPPAHSPSNSWPHQGPTGRPGWGHLGEPGWIGEWFGSATPGTSCLEARSAMVWVTRGYTRVQPTLQHIQTDAAQLVNVGMKDLGEETDLWWRHGVVVGKKQLELENTPFASCQWRSTAARRTKMEEAGGPTFIGRLGWAVDLDIKVAQVVLVGDSADARDSITTSPG